MISKPPRAAACLVELFVPMESAEGVLGDLEEEFAARLTRSGDRTARRWYWRQALRTTLHLAYGAVRTAPWSITALALASFVVASLLFGVMSVWVARLVSSLPIYDYNVSVWSWRAAAVVRFVAVPLALGWSIAVVARGREMVITTLVVGMLAGPVIWSVTISVARYWSLAHELPGLWLVFHFAQMGIFPLGLLVGGVLRRLQQLRSARIANVTFGEFRQTLAAASPPPLQPLLRALWHDGRGDWDEAHRIAQDVGGADAAWVHAYLHRKEGDPSNARYWYRQAGKSEAAQTLGDEWTRIVAELLSRR